MKQTKDKLSLTTTTLRSLTRPLTEQELTHVGGGNSLNQTVCYGASGNCTFYTKNTNPTNGCQ